MVRKLLYSFTAAYMNRKEPTESEKVGSVVSNTITEISGPKHSFFKLKTRRTVGPSGSTYLFYHLFC